jgi:hypothetical protein
MSDDTVAITGATGKTGRKIVSTALERGRCALCAADRPPSGSGSLSIGTINAPGPSRSRAATRPMSSSPQSPRRSGKDARPNPTRGRLWCRADRPALLARRGARRGHGALRVCESALLDAAVHGGGAAADLAPRQLHDRIVRSMIDSGELRLPAGTGRIPFIDTRDIDEVAVATMTADGPSGPGSDRSSPGRSRPQHHPGPPH